MTSHPSLLLKHALKMLELPLEPVVPAILRWCSPDIVGACFGSSRWSKARLPPVALARMLVDDREESTWELDAYKVQAGVGNVLLSFSLWLLVALSGEIDTEMRLFGCWLPHNLIFSPFCRLLWFSSRGGCFEVWPCPRLGPASTSSSVRRVSLIRRGKQVS